MGAGWSNECFVTIEDLYMSQAVASGVLAALIFFTFVYVINWKRIHKKWPDIRSPFYNAPSEDK